MMYPSRYELFVTLALHRLTIEEIHTQMGKFLDAAVIVTNETAVQPYINLSSESVASDVESFVQCIYHNGPKPRWLVDSQM